MTTGQNRFMLRTLNEGYLVKLRLNVLYQYSSVHDWLYQNDLNSDTCFMHFEYNIHWQNLSRNSRQLVDN